MLIQRENPTFGNVREVAQSGQWLTQVLKWKSVEDSSDPSHAMVRNKATNNSAKAGFSHTPRIQ